MRLVLVFLAASVLFGAVLIVAVGAFGSDEPCTSVRVSDHETVCVRATPFVQP